MAKEIERAGIPTALITAMVPVAQSVGAPRIVAAPAIVHPLGDPRLAPEEERRLRQRLVEVAFRAVSTAVEGPKVFTLDAGEVTDPTSAAVGDRWLH